jgi:ribosomal protein L3 glutamine methyltransferase
VIAVPDDKLTTPRTLLKWAVRQFSEANLYFGHGCDNAADEAAWLISHALHHAPHQFDEIVDNVLSQSERKAVVELLDARISKRLPTAYLTHQAWLAGHDFYVDERVIVPRSFFAELLMDGLSPWLPETREVNHALDLCTGSGCLAILMALAFPDTAVDATDLSPAALDVARINVGRYGLSSAIELIESDLFAGLGNRQYDLIISNPPYVTSASMAALPDEFRHEPALALAAGDDGLDIVRQILANASKHLTRAGILMIEVGHNADLVEGAFPNVPFTWINTESSEAAIFLLTSQELTRYCN